MGYGEFTARGYVIRGEGVIDQGDENDNIHESSESDEASDESSDESSESEESEESSESDESSENDESEANSDQAPAGWERMPSRSPNGFSYRHQRTGATYSTLKAWVHCEESVSLEKEGSSLGNNLDESNGEKSCAEMNAEINAEINGLGRGRAKKDRGDRKGYRKRRQQRQNAKKRQAKAAQVQIDEGISKMNPRDRNFALRSFAAADKLKTDLAALSRKVATGEAHSVGKSICKITKEHDRMVRKVSLDAAHHVGMDKVKAQRAQRRKKHQDIEERGKRKRTKFSGLEEKKTKATLR
jgi:hypothetical protein